MHKKKIAYSGIKGAFAYIVAQRIFPEEEHVSYGDFREAYDAVASGDCDYAVIPIDNSYSGEVPEVMDLLFEGDLYINALYSLPIVQNLLGTPDSSLDTIKTVVSHPKALEQCDEYIRRHGFTVNQSTNTARAAQDVAKAGDPSVAAIAGEETAELYGLKVLDRKINESDDNTTRFAILSKERGNLKTVPQEESFIMLFTVENVAGALLCPLQIIARFDINMKVLHSRPLKKHQWQYYFYIEGEGRLDTPAGQSMVRALREVCSLVKVLGPENV